MCGLSLAWVTSENSTMLLESLILTHSRWTLSHAASPLCSGVWCWPPLSVDPRQPLLLASLLSSRQLPSARSRRQLSFASPYHFRIRLDFMSKNPLSGFAPKQTRLLALHENFWSNLIENLFFIPCLFYGMSDFVNWITMTRKSCEHLCKHGTAVSTVLGFMSSVYRDIHHWTSNQRLQIAEPKLYNLVKSSYLKQVTPNQLVMVITWLTNLNVSCKFHD